MALRNDDEPVEEAPQPTIPAVWFQSDSDNDGDDVAFASTQIDTASSDGFLVSSVGQPIVFVLFFW